MNPSILLSAQCESDGGINWSYYRNWSFSSPEDARDKIFRDLERDDQSSIGAVFGHKGTEYNRKLADSTPVYRYRNGWKIGEKPKRKRIRLTWDQIDIQWPTRELLTTGGYVNPFDLVRIERRMLPVREITEVETHRLTPTGQAHVQGIVYNLRRSQDKYFVALVVNADYSLIDGHHRLEAVRLLKLREVPCCVVITTDDED